MSRYGNFVDTIPDLETQLGISSLEYLPVAINQSRFYGYEEIAQWLETAYNRLVKAVKEEWDLGTPPITGDTTGL
jgi:hypothetical protein